MTTELRVPAEVEIDRLIEPIIKWAQLEQMPAVVSVSYVPTTHRVSIVHPEILAVRLACTLAIVRNIKEHQFRRPHHTISEQGIMSEICRAAGGTLILEDVPAFRRRSLSRVNIVDEMSMPARPNIIVTYSTDDAAHIEKLRGVLPKITHHIVIE